MLLDEFIPQWHFREVHEFTVAAPRDAVREGVERWQPRTSLWWRFLLMLRGLGSPDGTLREWAEASGFLRLAENDDEVVYGQAGRFWALRERAALVSPESADAFRAVSDPGAAVAVMNISMLAVGPARTRIRTETRVRALSSGARRRFRLYWLLIRPFSGLLRGAMLRGIAGEARALAARSGAARG